MTLNGTEFRNNHLSEKLKRQRQPRKPHGTFHMDKVAKFVFPKFPRVPKRGAGAGVGVGMLTGGGDPLK